ncbi:HU family DNA-binding protein [Mucilaginibacter gilvus]|uniref:HU family DNA-binding protein n=1 Tax=Mucilaginibacter gilvus TaxID=2305909 RepID=UPI002938F81C|nr:HU family DNA-binding protein [Mucilaginibacter gilvus]
MTKAEVIEAIAAKTGIDKEQTKAIVGGFFKVINTSLENHEDVFVRGFGTFLSEEESG